MLEGRRLGEVRIAETKSRRSRRSIELTDAAVSALERHRQAQTVVGPEAVVFTRREGSSPLMGHQVYDRWTRSRSAPACLRCAFTTSALMLERGVHPKFVSEILGHSTIAITLDTYSHVTPAMHREAARMMDELLQEPE